MDTMHADRGTPALLLAVLYAVSGVLCAASALWPMHRDTPVAVLWALAATGVGGAVVIWMLGPRLRGWAVHAAVVLAAALIAVRAWQSATAVGIVGLGPVVIALGLYAAHFLDLPRPGCTPHSSSS
jgi:hypothetical protein